MLQSGHVFPLMEEDGVILATEKDQSLPQRRRLLKKESGNFFYQKKEGRMNKKTA